MVVLENCVQYNTRCRERLQEIGAWNGNAVTTGVELMDSLEEKARAEHESFVQLFVDPSGDISQRFNWRERAVTGVLSVVPGSFKSRHKEQLERTVVERCVQGYLSRLDGEVSRFKTKAESAEKTYERAISDVTFLRTEYVTQLGEAERCHEEVVEGNGIILGARQQIDTLLERKSVVDARDAQRTYIETEKHVRLLERERDRCANRSLALFHHLVLMHSVYEQSKVYSQFLGKNAAILSQTYDHLKLRWEEYNRSGNSGDVLSFLRWNEELKQARDIFDQHFAESLPLIRKVDQRVHTQSRPRGVSPDVDRGVYERAQSLRESVMALGPR